MIRAVIQDGLIRPLDPLPADWGDGRLVRVDDAEPEDRDDLSAWYRELQEVGPALYEPGERDQFQATLAEADARAKALVRRDMGLPQLSPRP